MGRWKKPAPATPQMGLPLTKRPAGFPAQKSVTDTSKAAMVSVGALVSGVLNPPGGRTPGDQFSRGLGNVSDLAGAMMGALRKQNQRRALRTFALAATVRGEVLDKLRELGDQGATADELAALLKRSPFTTRPRCTELCSFGQIKDSGRRRKNVSGRNAIVWVIG